MANNKLGGVSRRTFIKGGLAGSALAALAACRNEEASNGSDESTASGATLNYYINNPTSIDPYNAQEDQGMQVCFQLFDTLTIYDFDTNELVGLAAETWDVNDDATEFTFHLVEGATFHNGDPVNSEAFKRGWERICNPDTGNTPSVISYHLSLVEGYNDMVENGATELSGVSCPDDNTFVVKLSASYADFPFVCSHPALAPVPQAALDDFDSFFTAPIGNGPFQMDGSWVDGQEINLVRYDDYGYGEPAKVAAVHFSIQKDVETAYREFQAGNLDVCQIPTAQLQDAIDQYGQSEDGYTMTPDHKVLNGAELSTYYILCNMEDEQMSDKNLRMAISMAINRQAICDTCFMGIGATPADNIVPPGLDGYEEGAWPYAKYDVEAATAILDEYYPADADGNRGITLTLSYNLDGSHKQIMEMVIADLNAVGIQVESDTQEWATILDNYSAGNFQFGRLGWIADYPIMDNFIYPLFYTGNGDNRGKYSNTEVDAAIDAARATVDTDERIAALQEVNRTIGEDCPDIPIFFYTHTVVGSERIQNLNMNMLKLVDMAEVEIEE